MTLSPKDYAAADYIRTIRHRAIDLIDALDARAQGAFSNPGLVRPNRIRVSADLGASTLSCTATLGPVSADGVQLYRTEFAIDGKLISIPDAEAFVISAGLDISTPTR